MDEASELIDEAARAAAKRELKRILRLLAGEAWEDVYSDLMVDLDELALEQTDLDLED